MALGLRKDSAAWISASMEDVANTWKDSPLGIRTDTAGTSNHCSGRFIWAEISAAHAFVTSGRCRRSPGTA